VDFIDEACLEQGTEDLCAAFADEALYPVLLAKGAEHSAEIDVIRRMKMENGFAVERLADVLGHLLGREDDDRREGLGEDAQSGIDLPAVRQEHANGIRRPASGNARSLKLSGTCPFFSGLRR